MSGDKTFTGSCHCGHFNYTINLPAEKLANPTAIRCNCTFCQKRGFANLEVAPASFKLLSPASKSELGDYVVKTSEDCVCVLPTQSLASRIMLIRITASILLPDMWVPSISGGQV